MKYEEFKDKVNELLKNDLVDGYAYGAKLPKDSLAAIWETGGISGGSCWGDSDPQPYSKNDPEPELEKLDKILEYFKADISFIAYKNLHNTLVKRDEYTEYEYYGNETDYGIKHIALEDLYNYMKEKEWL